MSSFWQCPRKARAIFQSLLLSNYPIHKLLITISFLQQRVEYFFFSLNIKRNQSLQLFQPPLRAGCDRSWDVFKRPKEAGARAMFGDARHTKTNCE